MALQSRSASLETADHRGKLRRTLRLQLDATVQAGRFSEVTVHNLSETGVLVEANGGMAIGEWIQVELPHAGLKSAQVVWTSEQLFGCKFAEEVPPAAVSAALLRAPFDVAALPSFTGSSTHPESRSQTTEGDAAPDSDKLPIRTRALIILGLALACWAAVGAVFAALFLI